MCNHNRLNSNQEEKAEHIILIYSMETALSLLFLGDYINKKQEPQIFINDSKTVKRTNTTGTNVYSSANWRDYKNYVDKIAYDRYVLAKCPRTSNLIPNFYNQLQAVERRHAVYKQEMLKNQKDQNDYVLKLQLDEVEKVNMMYRNIGIVMCCILIIIIIVYLAMVYL